MSREAHALVVIDCEQIFRTPACRDGVHLFATKQQAEQAAADILIGNGEIENDTGQLVVVDFDTPSLALGVYQDAGTAVEAWADRHLHPGEVFVVVPVINLQEFGKPKADQFKLSAATPDNLNTPEQVVQMFNDTFGCRQQLTPKRRTSLLRRLKDDWWRMTWRQALQHAGPLPFFNDPNSAWRPNIDWFARPDTVVKIMEGRYDDAHTYGQHHKFHGKTAARETANANAFDAFERAAATVSRSGQNLPDDRAGTETTLRISHDR
jgi:hypothetical protein